MINSFNALRHFYMLIFLFTLFILCQGNSKVQMRIVHDTAHYGYFANNPADSDSAMSLVLRTKPANISGPMLLKKLAKTCHNITLDRYHYSFCHFDNITQQEMSSRWNSYQGVLGVWSHWNIENNTFKSMIYILGDACGETDRSVEVLLECGNENIIKNVTEPKKCHYMAIFSTKYACHSDALLVYPRLKAEHQKQWDLYYTNYKNGYITEKGYNNSLKQLFDEIGLTKPIASIEKVENKIEDASTVKPGNFKDVDVCNKEYENLKKDVSRLNDEIESLKVMMDLDRILNKTKDSNR